MEVKGHIIIGIHVPDRFKRAMEMQKIFTEYGCNIKTRLGLHEVVDDYCALGGIIILELAGDEQRKEALITQLKTIKELDVQVMKFSHKED